MAIYKSGVAIQVRFAPPDFESGLSDVKMEVYDEAGNEIVGSPFTMTEMDDGAATPTLLGVYEDTSNFTPDAQGYWTVICYSIASGGKTARQYKIEGVDVDDLATASALTTVDTVVDAIKAKTDLLPSDPADQSAVEAAITAAQTSINANVDAVEAKVDTANTNIGLIKDNTDLLPTMDTNVSNIETLVSTININVNGIDTQLDDVQSSVNAIVADTDELQTDLTDGGRLDLIFDGIKAKTDLLPSDPADQSAVEAAIDAAESAIRGGTESLETIKNAVDALSGGGMIL